MQKKLTITVAEDVYHGLHEIIGARKISGFIESLVRPHVVRRELMAAYRAMAQDRERESEARDWAEGTLGDASDETW